MDTREILLILHLIGAFLLVAGTGAETALGIRAATSTSTRVIAAATEASRAITNFVVMPGSLFVVVFGTWLALHLDHDFSEAWLSAAYLLWIGMAVLGTLVLGRHAKRVHGSALVLIAAGVEESETLRAEANETLPKLVRMLMNLFIIAFIYLMVAQPGS